MRIVRRNEPAVRIQQPITIHCCCSCGEEGALLPQCLIKALQQACRSNLFIRSFTTPECVPECVRLGVSGSVGSCYSLRRLEHACCTFRKCDPARRAGNEDTATTKFPPLPTSRGTAFSCNATRRQFAYTDGRFPYYARFSPSLRGGGVMDN